MLIWLTPDRFHRKPDKSSWLEMARHLRASGHQVTILTSGQLTPDLAAEAALIQVVRGLDLPLLFRFSALLNMLFWLWRHARHDDIIIVNPDALWLLPPLRWLGLRRVHLDVRTLPVDVHGFKDRLDRLLFWRLPLKWLGGKPVSYSFITKRLKSEVEKLLERKVDDHVIWQSGVNGTLFRPAPPQLVRQPHRLRLFYHGSLSINRGINNVISAIAQLEPRIDIEFVIVGDGSGAAALKALTRQHGLEHRIVFRGFLPYALMVEEINSADLCICPLPDRLEWNVSSPLKVFEYMACAKPMVLTPIAAHRDVLADAPFVVWSDGYNAESLCRAIEKAASELDTLTSAAAAAPALVAERHDWSRQAEKLERHLWCHELLPSAVNR